MRGEYLNREERFNRIILTACAVSMIVSAITVNEVTVTRYLSIDGVLEVSTIWTIRAIQALLAVGGIALLTKKSSLAVLPTKILMNRISVTACLIYILLSARWALLSPHYNWDILPYIACAISYGETDIELIHKETYDAVKQAGANLTVGSEYWQDMAANADHFYQQLPRYHVKPLYVALIYSLHKAGMSYVNSSVVISVVSVIVLFIIMVLWLARFTSGFSMGLLAIFLATASGLTEAARLSTPDALSALLIVTSLFLLIEKKFKISAYFVLMLSIFARPDNLILALIFTVYINVLGPPEYAVSKRWLAVFLLGIISISITVKSLSGFYSWWTLFSHTFLGELKAPRDFRSPFSVSKYANVLLEALQSISLLQRGWAFVGLFFVLTWDNAVRKIKGGSIYYHVAIAMLLSLLGRLPLYPEWEDRYFVAYYVMSVILFVGIWTERLCGLRSARFKLESA